MKESEGRRKERRGIGTAIFAAVLALAFSGTAFGKEPGWASEPDGWYYYLPDGSPGTGWIESDGKYYFLLETGKCLVDTVTLDGYYVDGEGAWYQRGTRILGVWTAAPDRFLPVGSEWNRGEPLATLQHTVKEVFGGARFLRVTDTAIEYISIGSGDAGASAGSGTENGSKNGDTIQETVLCGIYKETEQGRYRFDIRMKLNSEKRDGRTAATYDYEMFRTMIYQISSAPEVLEAALYGAWQGENQWKINRDDWVSAGDCQVMYTAGNGFGRFYIKPREV